jgi:hypothetical protein
MWFSHGDVDELARPFCKRRGCPDCGPRRCARLHRRYVQMLDDWLEERGPTPLVTYTIASAAWASHQRKLTRHQLPYQQLPLRDGTTRVITTDPLDRDDVDLVDDHHQLLAEVFTWTPDDVFETRRPSNAGWDLIASITETTETAGQSHSGAAPGGDPPPKRELVGFVGRSYSAAVRVLDQLNLEPEEIPERDLPDDWAEAHRFQRPDQDSAKWFLLSQRLRLWRPTTKAQEREVREYQRGLRAGHQAVQDRLPGWAA